MSSSVIIPTIKIDGAEISDALLDTLIEMRVRRAVRTIGRCLLRFIDHEFELIDSDRFKVGTSIRVGVMAAGDTYGGTPIFEGTVTSIGQRAGDQGGELEVIAEDVAFTLSRRAGAATYLNTKASDIISQVVSRAGATPDIEATTTTYAYTLQTDTDLAFIDELCRRSSLDWLADGTTFRAFTPDLNASADLLLTYGVDLLEFTAKAYSDAPSTVTVRSWDHLNKTEVVEKATLQRTQLDKTGLGHLIPGDSEEATVLSTRSMPVDQSEAGALAAIAAAATGGVTVRGRCYNAPTLAPGTMVEIAGVGKTAGDYYVREVEYTFRGGRDLEVSFVGGDREVPSLAGGEAPRSSFVHDGLVVGVVSAIENDPDNAGRVKVSLPGLESTVESHWARLAVLGGGASRGMVFVPEVNDEVLVGFEGGDVRRPVVLGGLFGTKDTIPANLVGNGKVESRRITSRLGHVVELSDGAGANTQHIKLALAGEAISLRLGKDRSDLKLPTNVPLKITVGSSSIELDGNGAITVSAATDLTLKAANNVSIEGTNVTLKATAKVSASGTQAELKGDATTTVQASGITAVKGGMVQIN
ncbi:phage baseplate assembly protein V [Actinotalea sp. M2MS4P-6]|uniref:phage baseplate assembly protein V n=1 Tax=Actinotalea sp. M2MS4P-6 TaxID=2983762 RepID=UPI0021E40C5D|nr:phage baseplate assembly protein V [Actinotalea sp. M2MS4P-6]MCV2395216.1 phage baseplate assembly protein V [Actinotalea sp. M2MS4P-6]